MQERHDSAGIITDLKAALNPAKTLSTHFVRSASYPFGEEGGMVEGMLKWEMGIDTMIIPDGAGRSVIDTGPYPGEAEAVAAKEQFYSVLGIEKQVELRGPGELLSHRSRRLQVKCIQPKVSSTAWQTAIPQKLKLTEKPKHSASLNRGFI